MSLNIKKIFVQLYVNKMPRFMWVSHPPGMSDQYHVLICVMDNVPLMYCASILIAIYCSHHTFYHNFHIDVDDVYSCHLENK